MCVWEVVAAGGQAMGVGLFPQNSFGYSHS